MTEETTIEAVAEPNNLKTFFEAAHRLNAEIIDWVEAGHELTARRDRLIELSPKCGVHKTATRDSLAKVSLVTREKKAKEPEPAPILDFIAQGADDGRADIEGAPV